MVVAYASASTLRACLTALPVSALHGVVVVDNASPDDSGDIARSVPGVQVLRQKNLGFGAGCNAGAATLPGAEFVLFLNPDAVVTAADLRALVGYLDAHPTCAVVGPRLYRDAVPLTSGGRMGGLRTELRTVVPTVLASRLPDRRLRADHTVTGPVGYVEGACFVVRAEDLRAVSGFDESFFLFFEEMDLARRLRARGRTVDLLATASAQHLSAVSRRVLSDGGRTHLLRSTVLYLYRVSPSRAWLYVALARLSLAVRSRGGLDPSSARSWSLALRDALRDARAPKGSP